MSNASLKLIGAHTYVTRTDANGRFQVAVVPGRYRVRMTSNAPVDNGQPLTPVPFNVTVTSSGKPLKLVISIK